MKNGLKKNQVKFTKQALELIATEYAREAGVRNYEKNIDKIIRKMVRAEVEEYEKKNPMPNFPTIEDVSGKLKKAPKKKGTAAVVPQEKSVPDEKDEVDLENLLAEEREKISEAESKKISAAMDGKSFSVDVPEVRQYLGKAVFDESQIKSASVPGTAIGLAWTSMGGDTLLLESISFESSKGGLQLTGQMGDVMKESGQMAMN